MLKPRIFHQERFGRITPEKQERILMAAAEEFADLGLAGANINTIAERAGISVGSLYKYFVSKNHLYLAVVDRGLSLLETSLNPILESEADLRSKIDGIIDAILRSAQSQPLMNRLYNRFTAESDTLLARQLACRLESITASAYTRLLDDARNRGLIPDDADTGVFAFCMDNVFLGLQFSLSTEYWRDRLELYLGGEVPEQKNRLKNQVSLFLYRALGLSL